MPNNNLPSSEFWDQVFEAENQPRITGSYLIAGSLGNDDKLTPELMAWAAKSLVTEQEQLGNEEAVERLKQLAQEMHDRAAVQVAKMIRKNWWQIWLPKNY